MAEITPITREEFYLAKAGGQDVPVPSAVTREEYYLEKLTNDNVDVPTPVTRREKFLYFACGGEIDLPSEERMTRLERLIAKAGGMDVSTPTAITRLEKFWANVEGGGWKTITGVLPLTFTAKAGATDTWTIYGNDEPNVNVFTVEGSHLGYLSESGEVLANPNNLRYTDYIELPEGISLTIEFDGFDAQKMNSPACCFYDSNKVFISGESFYNVNPKTFIIPANAVYFRTSYRVVYTNRRAYTQIGVGEQRVDGYYVPLTISQAGQPDKTVDIYIGDTPLTEGQQVSKTSTGQDIELFGGENTVSTTLYNKPDMEIKYK